MASAWAWSIYVNAWLLTFAIYLALAYAFWFHRQHRHLPTITNFPP